MPKRAWAEEPLDEPEPEWKCNSNDEHLVGEPRQRDRALGITVTRSQANAATARIGTETAS